VTTSDLIAAIADMDLADAPAVLAAVAARLAHARPLPEPQVTPDMDVLLSVTETAKLLSYRASYVYEMLRRGDLPAVRDRKFVRVRQSAVNEYIAQHERRGPLPLKVSRMLTSSHDRKFDEAQAQGTQTHPGRARSQTRVSSHNGRKVGNGPQTDS
jgi:excisionase family DNA binding protein